MLSREDMESRALPVFWILMLCLRLCFPFFTNPNFKARDATEIRGGKRKVAVAVLSFVRVMMHDCSMTESHPVHSSRTKPVDACAVTVIVAPVRYSPSQNSSLQVSPSANNSP